jgi:hypothetical protein
MAINHDQKKPWEILVVSESGLRQDSSKFLKKERAKRARLENFISRIKTYFDFSHPQKFPLEGNP